MWDISRGIWCTGSVFAARGLSSETRGILVPWSGFDPASLSWKANSLPLDHQGRTLPLFIIRFSIWTLPKGNQSWIFIGKTNAKAEAPILWPPDAKSWLIGNDPDAGKDWRPKKKEQPRMRYLDSITYSVDMNLSKLQKIVEDRGALACCSPWGLKESDTT